MKQLLMIVPFFPPMAGGGVYRPLSFVKYLESYGWRPTVIAPRGDAFWIRDERLLEQVPDSCRVIRTDTMSGQGVLSRLRGKRGQPVRSGAGKSSGQKRSSRRFALARKLASTILVPDTYVGWARYAKAAAKAAAAETRFDAVYSTSPPETSHLIGRDIHKDTGLPWVADFRDPWMNLYLFRPPTPFHARIHARLEKKVCDRAYSVVATRWHEQLLRDKYPGGPGVRRISNGYDAAEAATVDAVRPTGGKLRITHAGMLTQNRTAEPFLRGVRRFLDNRPDAGQSLEVVFVGAREDRNEEASRRLGLDGKVEFRDSIPHDETLQLERGSHILLLIKHVNPDYSGIVPGKLYEYIGLRRPILALVPDGEAARLVTSLNRGVVAPQQDAAAIARILDRLYTAYKDGSLDSLFDLTPREQFSRKNLAGELAALLDEISQ
jgi:hypothetical protein